MQLQELFNLYDPNLYALLIGGSCLGADGIAGTNWDLNYNEIRFMPPVGEFDKPINQLFAWQYIKESIDRNIYFSFNPIQQITPKQFWLPDELTYKRHIDKICKAITDYGGTKVLNFSDLSVDNEPLKDGHHPTVASYKKYIGWASQVAKSYGFKLSAGSEEFNVIEHRVIVNKQPNLIEEMCRLVQDDIIDYVAIHIQASCANDEYRKRWTEWLLEFKNRFGITYICNEANYEDPRTTFYSDWIPQIKMALDVGAIAIGFVFIDYFGTVGGSGSTDYSWLALFKNGNLRVPKQTWLDFRELSIKYKKEIKMTEYLRPVELQALYDAFGFNTPYRWQTPNLYTAGQKDPARLVTWADIDAMTETQLKGLISGLKKIGVLQADFPDYPNIKYKADGTWNPDWQTIAKSGGIK